MKVSISLDDRLIKRIDNYSVDNYMTRSGFISLACSQFLHAFDVTNAVKDMNLAFRKIVDKGMIDDKTLSRLEEIVKMIGRC